MNDDIQITKQLFLATQLFEKVGDRIFATRGLTVKTHQMLLLIEAGSNTTTALAKTMNLTLPGITQKTKILEKNELISRKMGTDDLRIWQKSPRRYCLSVRANNKNALFWLFAIREKTNARSVEPNYRTLVEYTREQAQRLY